MDTLRIPDNVWVDILHGKEICEFESLSLKILLSKLKLKTKTRPEDELKHLNELKLLVKVQLGLPSMQRDIKRLKTKISNESKEFLFTVEETTRIIEFGQQLLIAGDENLLKKLPRGNWIAGTIPYFMGNDGGLSSKELLFVNQLPEFIQDVKIVEYTTETINQVYIDTPKNGFTVLIIPASSPIQLSFALNALNYENFATNPVIGWISGVMLDEIGAVTPKVAFGDSLKISDSSAVAMHIKLPEDRYAELSIINIFEQGKGDSITFNEDGFSFTDAYINGTKMNFTNYLVENNIDIRLPLVADYSGISINTSFQKINDKTGKVELFAPVFKGITYKIAKPLDNYVKAFKDRIDTIDTTTIVFSCNCILNYVYGELEGEKTENITCPITFGEIAYQHLNQTLAYLKIEKHYEEVV